MSQATTTVRHSVCPLDCPDTCSLNVEIEGDTIVKIRGSNTNPFTEGVICSKVTKYYPEFVHGTSRLRYPMKRVGNKGAGEFERISWGEALDTIYEKYTDIIANDGSEAIVPFNYSGPHGMLAGGSMDLRFFYKLGASRLNRGPLCAGIWGEAFNSLYGPVAGLSPEQALHSKLVVIWGNNTAVSNLHFHRILKQVREQGGKVVVVDPKRIKIAKQADLHIQLKPGTDVVLAMAVAADIEKRYGLDQAFIDQWVSGVDEYMAAARQYSVQDAAEICGITEDSIREMADLYYSLSPASLSIGIGPERNRNGGSGVRAVLSLPALCGKFGVAGGGIIGKSGNAFPKTPEKLQRPDFLQKDTRTINILDVPGLIENPDANTAIKSLFIYNHNPIAVHPEQNRMQAALENEDVFVVGCDVAMTDSMALADIILPACTHFEHSDVYAAYGQNYLQKASAVIPAVGESLPNTEIFRKLAQRFGFSETEFSANDAELMRNAVDTEDARMNGTGIDVAEETIAIQMQKSGEDFILFHNEFPKTPSGKVELYSEDLAERFSAGLPGYKSLQQNFPLIMVSPSSNKRTNSTFGGVSGNDNVPSIEIHPLDAEARQLINGGMAKIWNSLGNLELKVLISTDVRPGVVYVPKGAWCKTSSTGQTVNALIPGHRSDIGDGACYNDACVEVAAL